jgi:hypothetical protein
MCDYSLHTFPNRLAVDGEELVIHRFGGTSLGLASPADVAPVIQTCDNRSPWDRIKAWFKSQQPKWDAERRVPAVCIPPGSRLLLHDIPANLQRELRVSEVEAVTFTQISAEAHTYRDAVRFDNNRQVLLQALREGQRVSVVSLSLVPEDEHVLLSEAAFVPPR